MLITVLHHKKTAFFTTPWGNITELFIICIYKLLFYVISHCNLLIVIFYHRRHMKSLNCKQIYNKN
jgi:hypothetical protein